MLKYFLISSALSTEKGSCYDSVTTVENLQMEDIINQMIEEGSGLTRPQAIAYYEKFSEVILKNLKFDDKDLNQGVFFIPENRNNAIVRVSMYSDITPLKVFIQVPELQSGNYKLVVKTIPVNCTKIVQGESGFILQVTE
jgi:hypothetical protein